MEQDQIAFLPVMWVDQLGRNPGPLDLVEQLPDLGEVGHFVAVWVECGCPCFGSRRGWKGFDEEGASATGVDLDVKFACDWVFPALPLARYTGDLPLGTP
jgi:hypothetical protein